jgi:hypothetical protein
MLTEYFGLSGLAGFALNGEVCLSLFGYVLSRKSAEQSLTNLSGQHIGLDILF